MLLCLIIVNQQEHGHNSVKIIIATTIAGISGILSFCIFVIYRVRRSIAGKLFTHIPATKVMAVPLYIWVGEFKARWHFNIAMNLMGLIKGVSTRYKLMKLSSHNMFDVFVSN